MLFLMLVSPFNFKAKIDFKINWLTEQFVSFKQPFHDLVYTIIYYLVDPNSSYKTSIIIG
jgi:flagellar assembly factor FliW